MSSAESPQIFSKILLRRLEEKVMAERKVFLYDNSCNLHKTALNRGAKAILNFKILTDQHHWKNHTGCSESYNCDNYDFIKDVNSQICEQKNCSLRKLSATLAYCDFKNYKTKIKLFFIVNNMEENQYDQVVESNGVLTNLFLLFFVKQTDRTQTNRLSC